MTDEALPEPDCVPAAPHPRMARALFGQDDAEQEFLAAVRSGRLPHGWLLAGPRGVGKATFAWRAARYLIATPPDQGDALFAPPPLETLDIDSDHPVAHRLRALSEPALMLLRRPWDPEKKRLKTQLTVEEVRGLKGFFALSSGGGRRVVIVDSADEMNSSAANALLKELEEPPRDTVLFLVSHQPSGLLPTIRSRCRTLRFQPLSPDAMTDALHAAGIETPKGSAAAALTTLASGSAGEAVRLLSQGGPELYGDLVALLSTMPDMDRPLALRLAEATAGKDGEGRFDLTLSMLDTALTRLARTGATGHGPVPIAEGEDALLARLAPNAEAARAWADLAATLTARARQGRAVNLDPAALTFDMFLDLDRTAARLSALA